MSQYGVVKAAAPPQAPNRPIVQIPPEQLEEMQNPAITTNKDAWKQILQIGLLGLGTGAGTRALLGMRDLFSRPSYAPPKIGPRPAVVEVNVPQAPEEVEQQRKLRRKLAADASPQPGRALEPIDTPQGPTTPDIPAIQGYDKPPSSGFWDYVWGKSHVPIKSKPFFWPAAIGAGMLGLYGGWKGVGAISDWHHEQARKRELEDAKREYRNALVEQFNSDKSASASVATDLDALAASITKQASAHDMAGAALGGYLTLAGLLAAGSGMATYNYVKSKTPENRLAKAIKQRERLRWASRPPEIYAVSKPSIAPEPTTALQDESAQADDTEEMMARTPPSIRKFASLYKG